MKQPGVIYKGGKKRKEKKRRCAYNKLLSSLPKQDRTGYFPGWMVKVIKLPVLSHSILEFESYTIFILQQFIFKEILQQFIHDSSFYGWLKLGLGGRASKFQPQFIEINKC